ncbi:glutamine--fructose-6-phosphate aminotransferase [isomerizing] 1-like isoform X1 [Liolophura sinensis]|uniref:glutamine--fructose-6-phosphate aminotransferase [isomerizing] 1-like isoform X1 n=1 Tax=Liolophura sinensis TaxID=3198878 RepID=UPI0031595256
MCGIFAYLNHLVPATRKEILEILFSGVRKLEYRGYDSFGIGVDIGQDTDETYSIKVVKNKGKVSLIKEQISLHEDLNLDMTYDVHCGIAHTRWATHGAPSMVNSHPQRSDPTHEFIVVHNGIITNFKVIKLFLEARDFVFESETDTEVIPKLIKHLYDNNKDKNFRELVEMTVMQLEGAFALVFKSRHFPGECVATRRGSPMLVGVKTSTKFTADHIPVFFRKDGQGKPVSRQDSFMEFHPMGPNRQVEYFISSDPSAIIEYTNRVIYLEDDDVAAVSDGCLTIHRLESGQADSSVREVTTLQAEIQQTLKGNFSSFLQKEIFEQPESVINTLRGRVDFKKNKVILGGLTDYMRDIRRCRRLIFIGCGTSYHSAMASRQLMEEMTELPVVVEMASNFLDRSVPVFRDDVCFFLSQSGETADTLLALRYCRKRGAIIVGVTNIVGSSISKESHCGIHINAGPEIGVVSTKAFTSQFIALVLFALLMSEDRLSMQPRRAEIITALKQLSDQIKEVLKVDEHIHSLAEELYQQRSVLVMGRGYNYSTCLEGAQKIKELTYMHSEGIMAGELKHGPLALIDKAMPVIMIVTRDHVYSKCMNALQQVTARHGRPILICCQGDEETKKFGHKFLEVPHTVDCLQSILTTIPLQLLAFHIAVLKGYDTDQPRHLLKTYTIKDD